MRYSGPLSAQSHTVIQKLRTIISREPFRAQAIEQSRLRRLTGVGHRNPKILPPLSRYKYPRREEPHAVRQRQAMPSLWKWKRRWTGCNWCRSSTDVCCGSGQRAGRGGSWVDTSAVVAVRSGCAGGMGWLGCGSGYDIWQTNCPAVTLVISRPLGLCRDLGFPLPRMNLSAA